MESTLGVQDAYNALNAYGRDYGELPLRLLLHVAVPQRFRPDFVNLAKVNFLPSEAAGDLSLDADVLFAPFVEATGAGYYRLDSEVRRQCLLLLEEAYAHRREFRSTRVADLLLAYLEHLEHQGAVALDPLLEEYITIERWVASAYLAPAETATRFAEALQRAAGSDVTDRGLLVRFGPVASAITIPLAHAGLKSVLAGRLISLDLIEQGPKNETSRAAAAEESVLAELETLIKALEQEPPEQRERLGIDIPAVRAAHDVIIRQIQSLRSIRVHDVSSKGGRVLIEGLQAGRDINVTGAPPCRPRDDFVECSAFSREVVKATEEFLVQAAVHLPSEFEKVAREANRADPGATRRKSLELNLDIGQQIMLSLEARGAEIEDPVREFVWYGRTVFEEFDLIAPAAGFERLTLKLKIYRDGNPAGRCIWTVIEGTGVAPTDVTARFQPYRRAFLSYSSKDRIEVLKFSQALNVLKIDFFQDLLSLEPGDRFAQVIERELEICDLFVLFWSSHSVKSEWVKKEAILALAHQQNSEDQLPDFAVMILETPPPDNPHPELKSVIHLNDMIRYVIDRESEIRHARPG